jgi:ppGpp synthetase/RelA/SpoT-type nucleotidyltranferase
MANPSKTQIDRLGDRLKKGAPSDDDLRLLDDYRRSFRDAFDIVIKQIEQTLKLHPTGRPAKSIPSIIQKLQRESIRLSQIQDIAGCRIVVADILKQDKAVDSIRSLFPSISVVDRREKSSHGYRAVHLMAQIEEKLVEIQVRTELQHLWSELSERCSDVFDPGLKYGTGEERALKLLQETSDSVARIEMIEMEIPIIEEKLANLPDPADDKPDLPNQTKSFKIKLIKLLDRTVSGKELLLEMFATLIAWLEKQKEAKQ